MENREVAARVDLLVAQVQVLASRLETRIPLVDGFDDRIARAESLEKSLASVALKLAGTKALTSWVPGAVAGAVAGATVAWVFFHSALALAH